jgi:hypothetical protein
MGMGSRLFQIWHCRRYRRERSQRQHEKTPFEAIDFVPVRKVSAQDGWQTAEGSKPNLPLLG